MTNSILDNMRDLTNTEYTENGDLAVASTFNANLDFFALASAKRAGSYLRLDQFTNLLIKALTEDPLTAIKNIFYLRDVRAGNGERALARYAFVYTANNYPEIFKAIIQFIPEVGRWDDLTQTIGIIKNEDSQKAIADLVKAQLEKDTAELATENKNISLLAKWLPSPNTSSIKTKKNAALLASLMGLSRVQYMRLYKPLRKQLNLIETKLTEGDFTFDYAHVPGQAMKKYESAFKRKDTRRYDSYIDSLTKGDIKVKTDTYTAADIVRDLDKSPAYSEAAWRDLKRDYTDKNMIVVRDGSGSMQGQPDLVATSLAIYASECLTGPFKDKFITFSERPRLIEIPAKKSLKEKVRFISAYDEISNTNIEAVYNLILKASMAAEEKDQIDTILIISDMEFDMATSGYRSQVSASTYDNAKRAFAEAGVKFPHIVFWNVDSPASHLPASNNDNVSLVSGYSQNIFMDILKGDVKTPSERMALTLSKYDYLNDYLKDLL